MDFWGMMKNAFQKAYVDGFKKKLISVGAIVIIFIIVITILVTVILDIEDSKNVDKDKIISSGGIIKPFKVLLSKEEFIACVKNYDGGISYQSNMVPYAEDFYDICVGYDISPEFAFAHSCLETGYGKYTLNRSNYFGLNANNDNINNATSYNSCAESIKDYCELMVDYRTPGAKHYNIAMSNVEKYSPLNPKLVGTPEDNLYVLYMSYSWLDSTHTELNYGLIKAMYGTKCTHSSNEAPTDQEEADYKEYATNLRLEIMEKIFGINVYSTISSNSDIVNKAAELYMRLYTENFGYNQATAHSGSLPHGAGNCDKGHSHGGITDCSAFVDWVLVELGESYGEKRYSSRNWVSDIQNGELAKKGWLCFQLNSDEDFEKIQPGDIWVRPGHMFIIAEVYRDSNGAIRATSFDAGGESNWLNHNGQQSEFSYIKNKVKGPYIVRISNNNGEE